MQELNSRFSEQATELLVLCTSLDPKDSFSSLKIDDVCTLASKFYPADFSDQEITKLRCQLQHYELDVPTNPKFQNLTSVGDLCRRLVETKKSEDYYLIDRYTICQFPTIYHFVLLEITRCILTFLLIYRLIRLVLTLPVSTATSERAFSAMKVVKTRLRNKMEDAFFRDCLVIYIEKELAVQFTTDDIIDDFYAMKTRKVKLK
jgi:hypothetical protein